MVPTLRVSRNNPINAGISGRCRQTFPGENLILRLKDWVLCSKKTDLSSVEAVLLVFGDTF